MLTKSNTVRVDLIDVREFDGDALVPGLTAVHFAAGATTVYNGVFVVTSVVQEDDREDDEVEVGELLIEELEDAPGRYRVRWRIGSRGTWGVRLRVAEGPTYPAQNFNFDAETQDHDLDDLAAAVDGVLVEFSNIGAVVAGQEWEPHIRFRYEATRDHFDPDPIQQVAALDSEGELIEVVLGADAVRDSAGRYHVTMPAMPAGAVHLRVVFRLPDGVIDVSYTTVVYILSEAAGEVAAGGVIAVDRVYTYPSALTGAGYDLSALSALQVWELIRNVSAVIDAATQQWFNGEYGLWYLDGNDRWVVEHKTRIRIIDVEKIEVLASRTNYRQRAFPRYSFIRDWDLHTSGVDSDDVYELDPTTWFLKDRAILRNRQMFPGGYANVRVTGAFGWVDAPKKVSTTTTSEVTGNSTSLTVVSTSGFSARSVVDLIGTNVAVRMILRSVNRATGTLTFDALGATIVEAIEEGATIRTWGTVPRIIEQVANYLFGKLRAETVDAGGGGGEIDPGRLKMEQTDDYRYELFPQTQSGATTSVTGHSYYDGLLAKFHKIGGVTYL